MFEDLSFFDLTDDDLCWLLDISECDEMHNNDFNEFIKSCKVLMKPVLNISMMNSFTLEITLLVLN